MQKSIETLRKNAHLTSEEIKKHISAFSTPLSFSQTEGEIKKARSSYRRLSSSLLCCLGECEGAAAEIARLVCRADLDMNNELTSSLSELFDAFCSWREAISRFMDKSRVLLEKDSSISISEIRRASIVFLSETELFIGILNTKI